MRSCRKAKSTMLYTRAPDDNYDATPLPIPGSRSLSVTSSSLFLITALVSLEGPALCCRSFIIPYTLGRIATATAYRGYPGHTFIFIILAIHIRIVSLSATDLTSISQTYSALSLVQQYCFSTARHFDHSCLIYSSSTARQISTQPSIMLA